MDTLTEHLTAARSAYRRRDSRASYESFVRADAVGSMTVDDLDAFATAAWLLGHGREAARLSERVYERLARTDPAAAAMKAAGLSLMWRMRGHRVIASDWAAKARVLLPRAPTNPVRGYLAYVDAAAAVDGGGDVDGWTRELRTVNQVGGPDDDSVMAVLATALEGIGALADGRVTQGCRLLDDVLMPVLDPRVALEWGGDVYRLALRGGAQNRRVEHVRAWAESMRRWSEIVDSSAYRAICDIHLLHVEGARSGIDHAIELRRAVADMDAAAAVLVDELVAGLGS